MTLLESMFCGPKSSEETKKKPQKLSNFDHKAVDKNNNNQCTAPSAANNEKNKKTIIPFSVSIKFLYKNPIGRQFTRERLSKKPDRYQISRAKYDPALANDELLSQYVHSIPNAIRYKGVLLQGYLVSGKVLRKIERFSIRPEDVWLASYPKSGTTWTEEILSLIFNDGTLPANESRLISERVPHLEVGRPLGHISWLNSLPSPRLLATHLKQSSLPLQLQQSKAKIIYVVRNPKDNAVSYYHHHRMSTFLGNYSDTWQNYLELFMRGQLVYGDWFEHAAGYWQMAQQYPDRVLVISYEELKMNLSQMIEVIANFVGRPQSAESIASITQHCTFDVMKHNKLVNREMLPVPDLFDMSQTKFMRKGIIGDWRNHFSSEESDQFDKLYQERLDSIELRIAYDSEEAEKIMADNEGRIITRPTNKNEAFICQMDLRGLRYR